MSFKNDSDDKSGECLMNTLFHEESAVPRGVWLCTVSTWKDENDVFMLANYLDGWTQEEVEDAINEVNFVISRGG